MCRGKKALRFFWMLTILIAVLWDAYPVDLYAAGKGQSMSQEEKNDEIRAYEDFLNGTRRVLVRDEMRDVFGTEEFLTDEMIETGALLEDFLEQITKVLCCEDRLISVEYAYLDLGKDGKLELAVRFCGHIPIDDGKWTFVIVYEDGKLFLRHAFESWSRNRVNLYYYGCLLWEGSSSAYNLSFGEEFIDHTGRSCPVYEASYDWSDISKSKLGKQVFDEEETWSCTRSYNIQEKRYHIIKLESEDVDADQWEEFCTLYEQKYDTLYTEEEIEQLIQKRRDDIGIKDAWLAKKELDWQLLENEKYREYVKEIDLIEARKEQHAESESVLKDKWIACKSEKYAMTSTINNDCFDVDSSWNNAIEYCLSDYCEKTGIPKGEWTLQRIISYGDGVFAVALSNDQLEVKRALCLLINSDALKAGLEEYSQYIAAVDFQHGTEGKIVCNPRSSYDSMLEWNSYQELKDAENPYTVREMEDSFFIFIKSGNCALSQYLKNKHADNKGIWKLDINAICSIGEGRIVALRYICGNQEVVMLLDKSNQTFAVIKGLNGE